MYGVMAHVLGKSVVHWSFTHELQLAIKVLWAQKQNGGCDGGYFPDDYLAAYVLLIPQCML